MSVVSELDIDFALFNEFVDESSEKFAKYKNVSTVFTNYQMKITGISIVGGIMSTDIRNGNFANTSSIVNYRQSSFREVLPNMSGSIKAKSQSYGMAMVSFLTGEHSMEVNNLYVCGTSVQINLTKERPGSNSKVFPKLSEETFCEAIIKGFERDESLTHILFRFLRHQFNANIYDQSNNIVTGQKSAYISYIGNRSGIEATAPSTT